MNLNTIQSLQAEKQDTNNLLTKIKFQEETTMIRNYATQQIIERAYSVSTQELDRMESMSNCEMVAEAKVS